MGEIYNAMVKGFLRAEGRRLVNGDGETVILRGWGAGNWMNPEGFMIGGTVAAGGGYIQPKKLDRARSMDQVLRELCGTQYAKSFWPRWYRKYLGRRDVEAMAEKGYNSVRLVLDAAAFLQEEPGIQWNEDSFSMLSDVLDWCEEWKIYAILDLHAAPGGQSCGACDNGLDNMPHLFIDEESRERCMVLWEELARRYGNRWIVGGYDLLNEPLNDPGQAARYTDVLKGFYDELVRRIRAIDKRHLLTIEGTVWSTQMDLFDHDYDPECRNWCIHFHSYSYIPEYQEISAIMERSMALNVPVWMGEGGSDQASNAVFLQMLEAEGIGYSLWCWKTSGSHSDGTMPEDPSPAEYALPRDWQLVFDYADHGGPKPGYEKSRRIFDEYLENLDYDKCAHPKTRHQYNLRQAGITVPAAGYDHGEPGAAFSGTWRYGNAFQYREADRMKLTAKPGFPLPGPKTLWGFKGQVMQRAPRALDGLLLSLREGEFVRYTVRDVRDRCQVILRLCSEAGGVLSVSCAGAEQTLQVPGGGEMRNRPALVLPAGQEWSVRVAALSGQVEIESVTFGQEQKI